MLPCAQVCKLSCAVLCVCRSNLDAMADTLSVFCKKAQSLGRIQLLTNAFVVLVAGKIPCSVAAVMAYIERLVAFRGRGDMTGRYRIVGVIGGCQINVRE